MPTAGCASTSPFLSHDPTRSAPTDCLVLLHRFAAKFCFRYQQCLRSADPLSPEQKVVDADPEEAGREVATIQTDLHAGNFTEENSRTAPKGSASFASTSRVDVDERFRQVRFRNPALQRVLAAVHNYCLTIF